MQVGQKPSGKHRTSKAEPYVLWWLKYVQERPLATAGTVITVLGGLLLLIFFAQLGRMPQLDLAGATAILMAVAILGLAFAFGLTASAFGAGIMLRGREVEHPSGLGERWASALLAVPGMLSVIALAIFVYVYPNDEVPSWGYAIPFVFLVLLAVIFVFLKPVNKMNRVSGYGWQSKLTRGTSFFAFGCTWLVTGMSAGPALLAFFSETVDSPRFLFSLVLWTLWCYFSNVVVATAVKINILLVLGWCISASLIVLLFISDNWTAFPKAIIRSFGLGEIPVALVLTSEGCDYLNKAAGGRMVCRVKPGEKTAVVCPAVLRSRIGSPLFVALSPYAENGRWPQQHLPARLNAIAISNNDVPAWSQLAPMRAATAPTIAASGAIVTYLDSADKGNWMREQCGESPAVSSMPSASTSVQGSSVK